MELMNALLMSLPGTPIVYYGDEIGMGDNVYLGDRNGVRTPMQWSADRNAGFSDAEGAALYAPVISDPPYSYHSVNVVAQEKTPTSLLRWMRRLIQVRCRHKAFGRGSFKALLPDNKRVFVFLREHEGDRILCVNNLSRFYQYVELDLQEYEGCMPVELWGDTPFPVIGKHSYLLTLGPHNFMWLQLKKAATTTATTHPNSSEGAK
jgi:maltose alpha-D-glucosyltransferase/alpha-amylase